MGSLSRDVSLKSGESSALNAQSHCIRATKIKPSALCFDGWFFGFNKQRISVSFILTLLTKFGSKIEGGFLMMTLKTLHKGFLYIA